jgi:ADP-heptose:LPS heptosyltransferase
MHLLRNSSPLTLRGKDITLPPGEWLMQDQNAFEAALMAERGIVTVTPWKFLPSIEGVTWIAGEKTMERAINSILLIRSGAIGDLLLLSPCIEPLRKKYPGASIDMCYFPKHNEIMDALDVGWWAYPMPSSMLPNFDLIIPLENVIEQATEHATDAFARALGVTVTDYRPVYRVTEQEAASVEAKTQRRVALHLCSSSRLRNYPLPLWEIVTRLLLTRGWEVMLFGSKGQFPALPANAPAELKDCSVLTFREAAAVLATCDVFCGVDSSFFNLCPALGVPAIGLFGPVDWRLRVKEGSGQRAISGVGDCAPCGWMQSRAGQQWPENGPCNKAGYCVPLAEIKPERVVAMIEREAK